MLRRKNLLPEQVKEECQDKADDNACSDGKVESKVVFFYQNVAGQLSEPRDLWRQDQQYPDASYGKPYDDEDFSEAKECVHVTDTRDRTYKLD